MASHPVQSLCPHCNQSFSRLDLHLRRNVSCSTKANKMFVSAESQQQPHSGQITDTWSYNTFQKWSFVHGFREPRIQVFCSTYVTEFEVEEIDEAVKRSRSSSAPTPLDQISYRIIKMCPALIPIIVHLFNMAWCTGTIPPPWQVAVIKLLPKSTSASDPADPSLPTNSPDILYRKALHIHSKKGTDGFHDWQPLHQSRCSEGLFRWSSWLC